MGCAARSGGCRREWDRAGATVAAASRLRPRARGAGGKLFPAPTGSRAPGLHPDTQKGARPPSRAGPTGQQGVRPPYSLGRRSGAAAGSEQLQSVGGSADCGRVSRLPRIALGCDRILNLSAQI